MDVSGQEQINDKTDNKILQTGTNTLEYKQNSINEGGVSSIFVHISLKTIMKNQRLLFNIFVISIFFMLLSGNSVCGQNTNLNSKLIYKAKNNE